MVQGLRIIPHRSLAGEVPSGKAINARVRIPSMGADAAWGTGSSGRFRRSRDMAWIRLDRAID